MALSGTSTVNVKSVQTNPAATASQGGGQAVGLPEPVAIQQLPVGGDLPAVPASFAALTDVQTYLASLVAALK